jgi:hypothetical protein
MALDKDMTKNDHHQRGRRIRQNPNAYPEWAGDVGHCGAARPLLRSQCTLATEAM